MYKISLQYKNPDIKDNTKLQPIWEYIQKEIDQKKDERKKSKVVNEKQSKDVAEVDWDVLLTISVKKNDQTMLDQAHEIVVKISEATGGSFRVAQKERREIGDKRIIRLEGFYAK